MPTTITIEHEQQSPTNSSSRSASRSDSFTDEDISRSASGSDPLDESWDQVYSDEIEPSESASRPRTRPSERYRPSDKSRPTSARGPTRRHTTTERSTRHPPASRVHRHPALAPPSSVDPEDYPGYGRGYPAPPIGPYGGRIPPGYAPSSYSGPGGGGYAPPFGAPGALTHYGAPGGYPQYPSPNPFSPQPVPPAGGAGYFSGGHPPMPGHHTPAPYGHEMMPYPPQQIPGYGYQGYPAPAMPPQHMQYYPPQWPPSDGSLPGDPELEKKLLAIEELMKVQKIDFEKAQKEIASRDAAEAAAKQKAETDAISSRKAAEEKAAWERKLEEEKKKAEEEIKSWEKKLEEEKKTAQAKGAENAKKQIEAELRKAAEKAAEEKARADAKAAVAKAEADAKTAVEKAEADAKAAIVKAEKEAKEAVDKAEKEAKASVEKALAPKDDKKKPLRFKDAVGRKFSFPFHLCATWAGMEDLIKQAFLHVEVIGPHVHEGRYDLIGPNGEIILPQVWETVIEPDWSITMHMWPMPEPRGPLGVLGPPPGHVFHDRPRSRPDGRHHGRVPPPPPVGHRGPPPNPANWPPGAPLPPRQGQPLGGPGFGPGAGGLPILVMPEGGLPRPRRKPEPAKGVLGWMAGKQTKPSGKGPKKAEQEACRVM